MNHISVNGKIVSSDAPVLLTANRGYRYGDGLFETMKVVEEDIQLAQYHFERLFAGLSLLQFAIPKLLTAERLQEEVLLLCRKNECEELARVRLSFSRGNGGLYDQDKTPQYIIECWPLNNTVNKLNENGLVIGLYKTAQKSCDVFANIKSANFLPYVMAALFAKENKWNDCLVMNTNSNIADSTIANIFIIKEGIIITPPLTEGCVNGVMRRHLLAVLPKTGYTIEEKPVTPADIENADEVFLTNAINGIRWVRQFGSKIYDNSATAAIYHTIIRTIK